MTLLRGPVLILGALLLTTHCKTEVQAGKGAGAAKVPVVVANVERRSMPIELSALGTVEALNTVSVTAQVTGRIAKVHFSEGDYVKAGQLLFSIDPRPYQAVLSETAAQLTRNQALLAQAKLDAVRTAALVKDGLAPAQEQERAEANVAALAGTLSANQAAMESARINIAYTAIRSPLDGRTGSLLVHAGNVVQANGATPLVVIRTVKPVLVKFSLPAQHLASVRARMAQELAVAVTPRDQKEPALTGKLVFIDNTIDQTSGTITLKAEIENGDEQLWPGQYVDLKLDLGEQPDALVAPEAAIQPGQDGAFTFVIGPGEIAELRRLKIDRRMRDVVVVAEGLKAGERVVTDGQIRLNNGTQVTITAAKLSASSAGASAGSANATALANAASGTGVNSASVSSASVSSASVSPASVTNAAGAGGTGAGGAQP